ncbi:hypothetical protein [Pontibacter sp. G13]|uniref:hypothetical protein n=1 Tax=Pontibacter sp. G13 TaxID=3074898 RepID=UPI00288AE0C5|nr:hypothetical protein [Pontibacter sp. G13]WNJ16769.1 hypothetical protein RJD25_18025 [Pontibacter sp. G13]
MWDEFNGTNGQVLLMMLAAALLGGWLFRSVSRNRWKNLKASFDLQAREIKRLQKKLYQLQQQVAPPPVALEEGDRHTTAMIHRLTRANQKLLSELDHYKTFQHQLEFLLPQVSALKAENDRLTQKLNRRRTDTTQLTSDEPASASHPQLPKTAQPGPAHTSSSHTSLSTTTFGKKIKHWKGQLSRPSVKYLKLSEEDLEVLRRGVSQLSDRYMTVRNQEEDSASLADLELRIRNWVHQLKSVDSETGPSLLFLEESEVNGLSDLYDRLMVVDSPDSDSENLGSHTPDAQASAR